MDADVDTRYSRCAWLYVCNHSYSFMDIQIDEGDFIIWNLSLVFFNSKLKIILDENWMVSSRVYFDVTDIFVRGRVGVVV